MNKRVNKLWKATGRAEAITASNADFYVKLGEEVHDMWSFTLPVLWRCWLGDRKGIRPVKTQCWFVGDDILTEALHVL